MDKITKPNVRSIATGKKLVAKQIQAKGGAPFNYRLGNGRRTNFG